MAARVASSRAAVAAAAAAELDELRSRPARVAPDAAAAIATLSFSCDAARSNASAGMSPRSGANRRAANAAAAASSSSLRARTSSRTKADFDASALDMLSPEGDESLPLSSAAAVDAASRLVNAAILSAVDDGARDGAIGMASIS